MTVIVGEKQYAIQNMSEFITMGNQWTQYSNYILNWIAINKNDDDNSHHHVFDYPNGYQFRLSNGNIMPTDTTAYGYCLFQRVIKIRYILEKQIVCINV